MSPDIPARELRTRTRSNTFAIAIAWLLLGAGCSDLGEPLRLVPRAEVSATALDFGTVVVNGTATRSLVIANSGTAPFSGFASVPCAAYTLESGGGAYTVPPNTQHTVVVKYQPTAAGVSPCLLQLGGDLPDVTLIGSAALQLPGAQCVLSKTSIDFGALRVGASTLGIFTIRNPGTEATQLNVVSTCGVFSVLSGGGPRALAPGDSLVVTLGFAPASGGNVACAIATGPGCPDLPVSGLGLTISFANDLQPIMTARGCVGCHGWTQATQISDQPSQFYPGNKIVVPFDLDNSVLWNKITGTGRFGQRMPQGGPPLPAAEIQKFRAWILEGARGD